MKWLSDLPQIQPPQRNQRFVLTDLDSATSSSKKTSEPQISQHRVTDEATCTIVSNDARLIELCAAIAVGAAVRITQCADPLELPREGNGAVLWGSDLAPLAENGNWPVDVLVGIETDSNKLWSLASRIPKARVALLPSAAHWLGEYLGLWAMRAGHGHTLTVGSIAGGLGTTTLCVLLAHAATLSGLRSVVIDLDPYSHGIWPLVCAQPATGIGWEELQHSGGALAAHQLADALPQLRDTAVLTWSQNQPHQELDDQLVIRLLAAARQGFDFVVLDTGRTTHPQHLLLNQFTDRSVITANATTLPVQGEIVLCGDQKLRNAPPAGVRLLGKFPPTTRISKAVDGGELLDIFKFRGIRQRLADLCLIPQVQEQHP